MKLLRRVATPMAIGVIAVIAPVEVSVAIEIKQEMIKSPATINLWGIKVRRFTTESTPPIPFATPAKAPANKKIITIDRTPLSPAAVEKISSLSSNFLDRSISGAMITPISNAPCRGICENGASTPINE